jgi:hypothetical protein
MGLPEPNPLRARLAYVGFVFLTLTVLPVATTYPYLRRLFQSETRKIFYATWLFSWTWASFFLAFAAGFLFDFTPGPPVPHLKWYGWLFNIGAFAISWLSYQYQDGTRAQKVKKAYLLYILALANTGLLLYNTLPTSNEFTVSQLRLWIFLSGGVGGLVVTLVLHPGHRKRLDWPLISLYILYALSIYPVYVYPHIKSAFAGGAMKDVTVYFSSATSTFGCVQLTAKLLDESDQGFYLRLKDGAVLLAPRNDVDAITYGGTTLPREYAANCVPVKPASH